MGCRISKDEKSPQAIDNNEMAKDHDEKIDYKSRFERKMCLAKETPEPDFDLSDCNLKDVPAGVFVLCRVLRKEILNLSKNKLPILNGGLLSDLSLLQILDLSYNKLKQLPHDIHKLENLRELIVSNNLLVKLPDKINSLNRLELLDVSSNKLRSIDEINCMPTLRILNITGNTNLKQIPNTLATCDNLIDLVLDPDEIEWPPREVTLGGTENITKFLTTGESKIIANVEEIGKDAVVYEYGSEDCLLKRLRDREEKSKNVDYRPVLPAPDCNDGYGNENALISELQQKQQKQKEEFLKALITQQTETEHLVSKIQQQKDTERNKLIEDILRAEENANIVIENLLTLKNNPDPALIEKERIEEERLLEQLHLEHSDLRKQEVLATMLEILHGEEHTIQNYQDQRFASSMDIIEQERETYKQLKNFFETYEKDRGEIIEKICENEVLQKQALVTLIEKNDARTWGLCEQLRIVETQLAAMTLIEIEKKKFSSAEQMNELSEKRMRLTYILTDLLDQKDSRRQQLLDTLLSLEAQKSDEQDFWLLQYQRLLDSRPLEFSLKCNRIDPLLGYYFLVNGVIHCLPFLQKIWQNTEISLDELTLDDLSVAGIREPKDRKLILKSIRDFLKDTDNAEPRVSASPTAPPISPTEEATAHSVPSISADNYIRDSIESASECVICMEEVVKIIFLPCGHMCCCQTCQHLINACPMCRADIERKVHVVQS